MMDHKIVKKLPSRGKYGALKDQILAMDDDEWMQVRVSPEEVQSMRKAFEWRSQNSIVFSVHQRKQGDGDFMMFIREQRSL